MPKIIKKKYIRITFAALLFALSATPASLQAQSAGKIKRRADESFKNKDYYNAAKLYSAILYDSALEKKSPLPLYPFQWGRHRHTPKIKASERSIVLYQLAESYRLYNRYKDALPQYEQYLSLKDSRFPLAQLWYGTCLIAGNEPAKAIAAFTNFLQNYKAKDAYAEKARLGISTGNFIIASQSLPPRAAIAKLAFTGSPDGSNFALEQVNDSFFHFSTSRHESNKREEKVYPVRLYAGNFNSNKVGKIASLAVNDMNMAAASLSADGLTLYFTGWKENTNAAGTQYKIFYAARSSIDSPWHAPVALPAPVNVQGFNAKQPFITGDGRYLLFSSDQPGGYGKYDIWMVNMDGIGPAGKAINLGSNINTGAEEVAPFYDADAADLYFSSDGRPGMGGLDIYKTSGSLAQNQWNEPVQNLGAPLNSVRDDQYYRKNRYSDTAYLSSDRASSCCLEIFRAVHLKYTDTTHRDALPVQNNPAAEMVPDSTGREEKRLMDSIDAITFTRRYVNYDFASAKIRSADYPQLNNIIRLMKSRPALNILVTSFTDCIGSGQANTALSRKRSESVKTYLLKKGIDPRRINTDFFGKRHFILACKEDSSYNTKQQIVNRRSDLILTTEQNPKWQPSGRELEIQELRPAAPPHKDNAIGIHSYPGSGRQKSKNRKQQQAEKVQERNRALTEKLPAPWKKPGTVNDTESIKEKLAITSLLDLTSKLKKPDVIEEMTKRIPRKPLLLYSASDSVRVDLYDNGVFDYDTVSVIYNRRLAVYKQLLQVNKPITFYVSLSTDQRKNEMILFAENLGLTPPNSALMVITDGENKRTEVNVSSDLEHNTVIYFIKVKKQ